MVVVSRNDTLGCNKKERDDDEMPKEVVECRAVAATATRRRHAVGRLVIYLDLSMIEAKGAAVVLMPHYSAKI
jgi:hypothetical protein